MRVGDHDLDELLPVLSVALKVRNDCWAESVPLAVASGSTSRMQNQ